MVQAAGVAADQGTWGRYPGVGSCVSASEEKVVQTSHVITTKSFKEDVISILILWIRKQRLKKREWGEQPVYPTEWLAVYSEFIAGL